MTDPKQGGLLAVARIKSYLPAESLFVCTAAGSALTDSSLHPPFEAQLFFSADRFRKQISKQGSSSKQPATADDLSPSYQGPGEGRYQPVQITGIIQRKHQVVIKAQLFQPLLVDDPAGAWFCIDRKLLESDDSLYFYQLVGFPVRKEPGGALLAVVSGYLEAGAAPILVVEHAADGRSVYLPLHFDHLTIDLDSKECIVPNYDDFL